MEKGQLRISLKTDPILSLEKQVHAKIASQGWLCQWSISRIILQVTSPLMNPEYACIVVIADTRSGSYYGSAIAAPVFRDLADLIYATDPSFHEILDQPLLAEAERHLPTAMNGAREELVMLYEMLGIPYEDKSEGEDWVKVKTGTESVTISSKTFVNKAIPDVRGMGLRDALYLLENAGVKVLIQRDRNCKNTINYSRNSIKQYEYH